MDNETKFMIACVWKKTVLIKNLISEGVNIHYLHEMAFKIACSGGHIEIVKYLTMLYNNKIQSGKNHNMIDIHIKYEYGFRTAAENGHIKVMKYLINLYKKTEYTPIDIYAEDIDPIYINMRYYNIKNKECKKYINNLGNYDKYSLYHNVLVETIFYI